MTHSRTKMYAFAGPVPDDLVQAGWGKLKPVPNDLDNGGRFDVLDTSVGSIRKSGRVLIRSAGRLTLLADEGAVFEQDACGGTTFVAEFAAGPVQRQLIDLPPLRSLQPVGSGTLSNQVIAMTDGEGKTHVRLWVLGLASEPAGSVVTLVTVQGLRGYTKAFDTLATRIQAWDGAIIQGQGMQGLGDIYAHLFPDYVAYTPKPRITITKDEPAFETANDIIRTYINTARRTEAGVIADYDSEYLHDYRVSLRKVRSVLSLFKGVYSETQTAALKQTFSRLMEPTGPLRDLDVYLLDRPLYFDLLPASLHDGLGAMYRIFERERSQAQKQLSRRFASAGYKQEMRRLERQFGDAQELETGPNAGRGAYDYACELIWKRYRKVCKIARKIGADTEDEEVHALRIHCKKLRYLMEFFAPVFPARDFKKLIKPLKKLQDNLGLFNDYSVQQIALQSFLDTHITPDRKQDISVAQSIGALIVVLNRRQFEERARVVSSFAHFDSDAVQSKFRRLFDIKEAST